MYTDTEEKLEKLIQENSDQIKSAHRSIINHLPSRFGLYTMVVLTLFGVYNGHINIKDAQKKSEYQICLNQKKIQEQQSILYKKITGHEYLTDFPLEYPETNAIYCKKPE